MASRIQILAFGDQTQPYHQGLVRFLRHKGNPVLISFLDQVFVSLRREIGSLNKSDYALFPRFSNFADLLSRCNGSSVHKNNPALSSALCCTHQFASFISHYTDARSLYPSKKSTHVVGLCTGLLAGAAISSCSSVQELIPLAVETVLIAFRVGLRTLEVRNRFEKCPKNDEAWSVAIPMTETEAFTVLSQDVSFLSGPYVSAVTSESVTVSGPPSTLRAFVASTHKSSVNIPIYSPYHASHLYDDSDVEDILLHSSIDAIAAHKPQLPLYCNYSGTVFTSETTLSLYRQILQNILAKQLRLDRIYKGLSASLRSSKVDDCEIIPIAASGMSSLASALTSYNAIKKVDVKLDLAQKGLDDSRSFPAFRPEESKIAVIGFGGRFPESDSPSEFWDLLYQGLDVHKEIPSDRFDAEKHFDATGKRKNTSKVKHGCFINKPGMFDARFFNMSPREASQADPAQRLVLLAAYEALEMAGFIPDSSPSTQRDRVGIMLGTTSDDYREVNTGQNVDTYFIPGGNRAFIPGRINYYFKFSGPSYSVDTACSSSFASMHTACNALWRGDCDTVITGGTNILTNPDNFAGLERGHFLSKTGNCNTFDDGADGYCRADAIGVVVLKRLEDALADGDPVLATINAACTNHSAEAVSMTRPHVGAQEAVFDKILTTAGTDPSEISYIEMHGTGTQAGDASEMKSVLSVFSKEKDKYSRKVPLYLGSAKANIGHAESASGIASFIKVLLMLKHNTIPPHCGIKTKINHGFPTDLEQRNIHIAMKPTPWNKPEDPSKTRKAFLNNFSAAGGNTALLLEDYTQSEQKELSTQPLHLVAVSGKSRTALANNMKALEEHIRAHPDMSLQSLAYTTTARRIHYDYRAMFCAADLPELQSTMQSAISADDGKASPASAPTVYFAFTGQGAQYVGMAKQLLRFSQFQSNITRFDILAQKQGFPSFMPLITSSAETLDIAQAGPTMVQIGLVCIQMALAKLWMSWGIEPKAVIGHSLGEYAALNISGALGDSETIFLVGTRAQIMENKCSKGTHSMLAVKSSVEALGGHLASNDFEVACVNGPADTVISGPSGQIQELSQSLSAAGVKSTLVQVPYAFHSAQVDVILDDFEKAAAGIEFKKPSIPIASPLLSKMIDETSDFGNCAEYLRRHCREKVDFVGALNRIEAQRGPKSGAPVWLEVGPHQVCSNMVKSTIEPKPITLPSLRRGEDSLPVLLRSLSALYLAGQNLYWNEFYHDFKAGLQVLPLPSYKWDLQNHWIDYKYDWCLTKGDKPLVEAIPEKPIQNPQPKTPLSTCAQFIVEERTEEGVAFAVAESDVADPQLRAVFNGHQVNGVSLCPSSAYADMALTMADYLKRHSPQAIRERFTSLEVKDVSVDKPLIANNESSQKFRISAKVTWSTLEAKINIYSVDKQGNKTTAHCACTVGYANSDSWSSEWKRVSHLIQTRMESLRKEAHMPDNNVHRIKRGVFYRLFASLVDYDDKFKGYDEAILDSNSQEATGTVTFKSTEKDGKFYLAPYWIDGLGQLTGFVMNGNDAFDTKDTVYVNHGWESVRYAKALSASKVYRTYVRMLPINKTSYAGDLYIFDGEEIVGIHQGVRFQGIPRRLLNSVLPGPSGKMAAPVNHVEPARIEKQKPVVVKTPATAIVESAPLKKQLEAPYADASGAIEKALSIVAEEVGVDSTNLKGDEELAGLGIDSLMSLTITGKFREELDIEVDSSTFASIATISELRTFLSTKVSVPLLELPSAPSAMATPALSSADDSCSDSMSLASSMSSAAQTPTIIDQVRFIVAEEIGITPQSMEPELQFSELGMDSLLSLTVLSRLREELGLTLESDFFAEHPTPKSMNDYFGPNKPKIFVKDMPLVATRTEKQTDMALAATVAPVAIPANQPRTSSVLLQGNSKTSTKKLFLFPDGSGSSTSYSSLPQVDANTAVYGLNCPYLKRPEELEKIGLTDLTQPYVDEIRRRQPSGPYYLGGWSAGGICALDAAQKLKMAGEQVERLVLLDSPFPVGLGKLPPRLYKFLDAQGAFGGHVGGMSSAPSWLLPHFLAFIEALDKYESVACTPQTAPTKTFLLWARKGVCPEGTPQPEKQPDDPREMWWLLNNRSDFGPNGWDTLVGGKERVTIGVLQNANHFSMMHGENAKEISGFLKQAMA